MRQQKVVHRKQKRFKQELPGLTKENTRLRNLLTCMRRPGGVAHREENIEVPEVGPTDQQEEAAIPGRILEEIVKNSQVNDQRIHARRWDEQTMKSMFVLYATLPKCYSLLKSILVRN
jgi:hypothetical protein